jgi:hypothetical protein
MDWDSRGAVYIEEIVAFVGRFSICEWAFLRQLPFFFPFFLLGEHIFPHPFFREPRAASLLRRAVFFFFRLDIPLGVHCGTLLFFLLSLQSAQTGSFGIFAWRSDDDGT